VFRMTVLEANRLLVFMTILVCAFVSMMLVSSLRGFMGKLLGDDLATTRLGDDPGCLQSIEAHNDARIVAPDIGGP